MKVIDLLNKIANGEEVPKKIRYQLFELDRTYSADIRTYYVDKEGIFFFKDYSYMLNDEVEIIEEDKNIRKLDFIEEYTFSKRQNEMTNEDRRLLDSNFKELGNKINEIIDYLEENK